MGRKQKGPKDDDEMGGMGGGGGGSMQDIQGTCLGIGDSTFEIDIGLRVVFQDGTSPMTN